MSKSGQALPGLLDNLGRIHRSAPAHLIAAEFDGLVRLHGVCARWRRVVTCPCMRADSRRPDPACRSCRGTGRLYPPDLEEDTEVLLTSRTFNREPLAVGEKAAGSVRVTWPRAVDGRVLVPSFGDQLWPDNEQHVVQETLLRGGMPDPSRGLARSHTSPVPPPAPLAPTRDWLLYPDIEDIEYITWMEEDRRTTDARGRPRQIRQTGEQGREFELRTTNDGTWIEWFEGRGPRLHHPYTVRYLAPAVYMVLTGEPRLRMEAGQAMPYTAEAHRLDLFARGELLGEAQE